MYKITLAYILFKAFRGTKCVLKNLHARFGKQENFSNAFLGDIMITIKEIQFQKGQNIFSIG